MLRSNLDLSDSVLDMLHSIPCGTVVPDIGQLGLPPQTPAQKTKEVETHIDTQKVTYLLRNGEEYCAQTLPKSGVCSSVLGWMRPGISRSSQSLG